MRYVVPRIDPYRLTMLSGLESAAVLDGGDRLRGRSSGKALVEGEVVPSLGPPEVALPDTIFGFIVGCGS